MNAPPPPPPHGEVPRGSGLPPGKYDIFVIPEHSAGSGFLYLPSLQPNVNSFAAGFASALILVALFQSMAPAFRSWWESFQGLTSMGITLIILGVGAGAWALGRTQQDGPSGSSSGSGASGGPGGFESSGSTGGTAPNPGPSPQPPPHSGGPPPNASQEKPKPSWQRPPPPKDNPKGSWERARDEMRKKEEERKAKEAEQKRREDAAKRLAELRAKEAKERAEREKDKDKQKKELEEKLARLEKERKEREEKKKAEEQATRAAAGSSYAYSGVGEKTSMWPNGKPPVPTHNAGSKTPSPKKPPAPTAKTYISTDEDAYSFRPYDQPKKPRRKVSMSSIPETESSYAPSHTTAQTSPMQSARGPYTTKDPDKIVINAVYLFNNQFTKIPASQLLSGVGTVTDGLILRITTEGLFIDDDVRGVPQREWDVKAWTLKLVETGEWKSKGLQVLRATIRDQDAKRYLFVLEDTEAWKVTSSVQRLKKGSQARQLGVSNMSASEARGLCEMLGWS